MNIIPLPNYYKFTAGQTTCNGFNVQGDDDFCVNYLLDILKEKSLFNAESVNIFITIDKHRINRVFEECTNDELKNEAYIITVTATEITIAASTPIGAFYGIQSLRQYLCLDTNSNGSITYDHIVIEDIPVMKWRGYMLDIARHFFDLEELKRLIDLISMAKINKFHIHFSDDQGFRLDLKDFPKLKSIASKRKDTQLGGWSGKKYRGVPHEGTLNEEQIIELINYATPRGVDIIPEIDLPGHTMALVSAYPELCCEPNSENIEVMSTFSRSYHLICAGKESSYEFLFKLLDAVCDLFTSPYIHIGGDEAPKDTWKKCPNCQQAIKDNNLNDEDELQGLFTNRIADYLAKKGKRVIVWNEALTDNLDPSVLGQYWEGDGVVARENAISGREIISSHNSKCYLDYVHASISLNDIYSYNPYPARLPLTYHNQVIGVEAPLWTEWVYDRAKIDFNTFPRLIALSENAWTKRNVRSFANFHDRLKDYLLILDTLGVNYAPQKIYSVKSYFKKKRICKEWSCGDQYYELAISRKK